jgi:nucleotide-binding universal stress UspA family protein
MSEVILVVINQPEPAAALLDAARCLRALLDGGRIEVLALQAPSPLLAASDTGLLDEAMLIIACEGRDRRAATRKVFELWSSNGTTDAIQAQWVEANGPTAAEVELHGRRADYIVIARPTAADDSTDRNAFRSALFRTERPLLVVPPGGTAGFGRRIAVAWRDDGRAIKALLPAIRLCRHTERLDFLAGIRAKAPEPVLPPVVQEHRLAADLHVMTIGPGSFGKALLDRAKALDDDLLVMGAYAHHPLKDLILGGTTRDVLGNADLPLLMRH